MLIALFHNTIWSNVTEYWPSEVAFLAKEWYCQSGMLKCVV